ESERRRAGRAATDEDEDEDDRSDEDDDDEAACDDAEDVGGPFGMTGGVGPARPVGRPTVPVAAADVMGEAARDEGRGDGGGWGSHVGPDVSGEPRGTDAGAGGSDEGVSDCAGRDFTPSPGYARGRVGVFGPRSQPVHAGPAARAPSPTPPGIPGEQTGGGRDGVDVGGDVGAGCGSSVKSDRSAAGGRVDGRRVLGKGVADLKTAGLAAGRTSCKPVSRENGPVPVGTSAAGVDGAGVAVAGVLDPGPGSRPRALAVVPAAPAVPAPPAWSAGSRRTEFGSPRAAGTPQP
ncbi:MAG: hypothetical protein JWO31_3885, partial [Phycisphaerales bacterium]|nr:hypothetical protein [Phycisphaerales bacterium]